MKVYQPMHGLHGPVVVDPRLPNLTSTQLDVHCVPGDALSGQQASMLCQKVGALFENQGAQVRTHIAEGSSDDDDGFEDSLTGALTALTVELRARQLHHAKHPLSWVATVLSLTLVPGVTETTFAQDVVIRDDSGFLLVSDTLEGRLVTRFGFGSWASNALLDLARDDADKITGDVASRQLSSDLYRQLSQLVFNARMHAQVLQLGTPKRSVE